MIRRGEEWGAPSGDSHDVFVEGSDTDLAAAVAAAPGARIRFVPRDESDLARTFGLAVGERVGSDGPEGEQARRVVAPDALDLEDALDRRRLAVNAVVVGQPPDRVRAWHRSRHVVVTVDGRTTFDGRAWGVVLLTGQYLHGMDLAPRGHPGDGRMEVQVYAVERGQRRRMRSRLPTGSHVPHPGIVEATGRSVSVVVDGAWPCEVDGRAAVPPGSDLEVAVLPAAYRLLLGPA